MNTPTSINELTQSATIDEALDRLVAAHNRRVLELEKQRDELASCLQEAYDGFSNGRFTFPGILHDGNKAAFVMFIARCHTALLRCSVRARLDDKLTAERRGQEAQA